jgi:hypothetical protein
MKYQEGGRISRKYFKCLNSEMENLWQYFLEIRDGFCGGNLLMFAWEIIGNYWDI